MLCNKLKDKIPNKLTTPDRNHPPLVSPVLESGQSVNNELRFKESKMEKVKHKEPIVRCTQA